MHQYGHHGGLPTSLVAGVFGVIVPASHAIG
jgi:hypothetical protein